jgi:hypothetical protein
LWLVEDKHMRRGSVCGGLVGLQVVAANHEPMTLADLVFVSSSGKFAGQLTYICHNETCFLKKYCLFDCSS